MHPAIQIVLLVALSVAVAAGLVGLLRLLGWSILPRGEEQAWAEQRRAYRETKKAQKVRDNEWRR